MWKVACGSGRSDSGSVRSLVMPADEVERWRAFLAIEVPYAVRQALTAPLDALRSVGESLRINPLDRIHLTLHFLGQLSRSDVEHLETDLAPTVVRHGK